MAKVTKKAPVLALGGETSGRRRILVFCFYEPVAQSIVQILEKKNFLVWMVSEERKLLAKLDEADPELILVELNAQTQRPIDFIVADIFRWMRGRARAINKLLESPSGYLWEHSKIALFRSDNEISPTSSITAEIADTDDIIRLCSAAGDVKYIGLYSPMSFLSKIRPFLE